MIPKQLQNPEFKFVLLGEWNKWKNKEDDIETTFPPEVYNELNKEKKWTPLGKAPFEKEWQKKGYKFNDKKLLNHKGNIGIIGGYGNLVILDIDDNKLAEELEKEYDTFTIKTGTGGKHFYFICKDEIKNRVLSQEKGELRAENYQVVCPPSKHPNKNFYEIHSDKPIKEATSNFILGLIKPYLTKEVKSEIKPIDTSGSGLEYRRVVAMLREGKNKEEIFNEMMKYKKWAVHGDKYPQYREDTYNNALKFIKQEKKETKDLDVYDYEELMNYEPEPQDWLIEEIIPKKEVGLLVGKRGERKTFTALHFAICLAAKIKAFGTNEVPEKKRVLIIDEETGKNIMAQRMKALAKAMNLEKSPLEIKFFSFAGIKFDKRESNNYLKFTEIVRSFKPDLIIVDCLQRCVTFEVDKNNASISELFTNVVRPIIKVYGTTWIFIHHMRKSPTINYHPEDPLDEVRGGSELVNYCRFVLMCQTPKGQQKTQEEGELVVFKVLKMSNAPIPDPKVIAFTPNKDSLNITYEGIPEEVLAGEVQCANKIKQYLFDKQISEFKTKDIIDASDKIGFKKNLINNGLKLLWNNDFLEKVRRGSWKIKGGLQKELYN